MWFGNRCYPPKDVQLALESLFGESVGKIKVIQYSIFVRFHWRAIATTRPNRIYLRGSGKEFFSDGPLVLHEYFHVIRQWGTGRSDHRALSASNVFAAATGTIASKSKRANSPTRKYSGTARCSRSTARRSFRRAFIRSARNQPSSQASRRYSRPAMYASSTP